MNIHSCLLITLCCRLADALESMSHHSDGVRSDISRQIVVIECFQSLLSSLEKIVDNPNDFLDEDIVEKIFQEFPYLEMADYQGMYSHNLNNGLVRYSYGINLSGCLIVGYFSHDMINGLKIQNSVYHMNNRLFVTRMVSHPEMGNRELSSV